MQEHTGITIRACVCFFLCGGAALPWNLPEKGEFLQESRVYIAKTACASKKFVYNIKVWH